MFSLLASASYTKLRTGCDVNPLPVLSNILLPVLESDGRFRVPDQSLRALQTPFTGSGSNHLSV